MLDPKAFKAYDVRGLYPAELDEDGAYAIGRAFVEQFEPERDRGRARHARCRRRRWPRPCATVPPTAAPTCSTSGMVGTEMVYFAVGELGARRRHHGHRVAQPEAVHGDEDRARAARCRSAASRGCSTCATAPCAATGATAARGEIRARGHLGALRRPGARRSSTSRRSGRCAVVIDAANGMAGAMLPPVLERLPMVDVVRCYFEPGRDVPEPRAEPAAAGEPRVHHREDARARAPTSGSPTTATPTAASSSTTPASSCPATSSTALFAESILAKEPGGKVIYDVRASWAVPEAIERAGGEALINRVGPRVHQAAHARGRRGLRRRGLGALLLPRLLAGRLGHDPVPAHVRARLAPRQAERGAARRSAQRYFITGEINTPVADVAVEAAGAEGALRRPRAGSRTSTASRSMATTGTSTSARRTPSRSCA